MSCLFCGDQAAEAPDPRIPLLRIALCHGCRNRLARMLGWTTSSRRGGPGIWWRRGVSVEVPQ